VSEENGSAFRRSKQLLISSFCYLPSGGVAEQPQFYECADNLGILVFQEFWMTGDNNGRWAGSYSSPLNYSAYLANVEDTVKRLRYHASLLFYGGCNECKNSPWMANPPRSIDDGIRSLLKQFDPGRFYISSSMGGVSDACYVMCSPSLISSYFPISSLTGEQGGLLLESYS